jgi:hypothetical protein
MKLFALLSIWLALPLAAQVLKPGGIEPINVPNCQGTDTVEQCQARTKQTPLNADESAQLALLLMQAQAARITMLEKLMAKQAGGDDLAAADQASQAYTKQLQAYVKDHSACQGGQWNFAERNWACPSK